MARLTSSIFFVFIVKDVHKEHKGDYFLRTHCLCYANLLGNIERAIQNGSMCLVAPRFFTHNVKTDVTASNTGICRWLRRVLLRWSIWIASSRIIFHFAYSIKYLLYPATLLHINVFMSLPISVHIPFYYIMIILSKYSWRILFYTFSLFQWITSL